MKFFNKIKEFFKKNKKDVYTTHQKPTTYKIQLVSGGIEGKDYNTINSNDTYNDNNTINSPCIITENGTVYEIYAASGGNLHNSVELKEGQTIPIIIGGGSSSQKVYCGNGNVGNNIIIDYTNFDYEKARKVLYEAYCKLYKTRRIKIPSNINEGNEFNFAKSILIRNSDIVSSFYIKTIQNIKDKDVKYIIFRIKPYQENDLDD